MSPLKSGRLFPRFDGRVGGQEDIVDHSPYLGQPLRTYAQALNARRRPYLAPPTSTTEADPQGYDWITRAALRGLIVASWACWALVAGGVFLVLGGA